MNVKSVLIKTMRSCIIALIKNKQNNNNLLLWFGLYCFSAILALQTMFLFCEAPIRRSFRQIIKLASSAALKKSKHQVPNIRAIGVRIKLCKPYFWLNTFVKYRLVQQTAHKYCIWGHKSIKIILICNNKAIVLECRFCLSYHVLVCVFQVFIGFVLKQFEYIEVGQFR